MDLLFSSPLTLVVLAIVIAAHVAVAIIVRRMIRRDTATKVEDEQGSGHGDRT